MEKLGIEQIHKATLEILKAIDEICLENNFQYWIMYGSLIGAIRHKGFIPWDDDLDIAMPREDYDKFIKYLETHKIDNLKVDTYKNVDDYPFYIARLCDQRYYVEFENRSYTSGIFVDIYPFDGMGNDEKFWLDKADEILKIRKQLTLSCYPKLLYGKNFVHKIGNLPNAVLSKMRGRMCFLEKLDKLEKTFSWEESKFVSIPVWDIEIIFLNKEWFSGTERVKFEDIEVNIPSGYHEILTVLYGNYMELPPTEGRVPSHEYVAYKK